MNKEDPNFDEVEDEKAVEQLRSLFSRLNDDSYTEAYQAFLVQLKKARLEAGLTQKQVAKLFDLPQSFISKCESGERRVDILELDVFAKIYRKDLDWFFPGEH